MPNGKPKRGDSISVEEDEEEEDDDDAVGSPPELSTTQVNGKKGGQKKPETEEEKRRNFLERNRQGMFIEFVLTCSPLFVAYAFDISGAEMPSTEKGLVGPIAGEERVLDSGEPAITRGPREHTRGACSTYCRGTNTSCWRRSQCTIKCAPGQRERQFTGHSGR
jgi:hypothetical protein